MHNPQRPISSKIVSTLPIYIDSPQIESFHYNRPTSSSNKLNKLNQIIPELPHFGIQSNSTALLYSKFIVKGLKQEKIGLIKNSNKKKDEVTEADTICQREQSKSYRGSSAVGSRTHKGKIEEERGFVEFSEGHKEILSRAKSAKHFQKVEKKEIFGEHDPVLQKTRTELNLHKIFYKQRPTTAKITHKQNPKLEPESEQKVLSSKKRPTTANPSNKKQIQAFHANIYDPIDFSEISKLKQKENKLLFIESHQGTDHIERNIHNASMHSKKSSSIYLTNANIESLMSARKQRESGKNRSITPVNKISVYNNESIEEELEFKPQEEFSKTDKIEHERNLRKVENYLQEKDGNKFQLISEQIRKEQRNNKINLNENNQELLSKNLDNRMDSEEEQINDQSAKACFEDYVQHCEVLQYNMLSKRKEKQKNDQNLILNVWECQKLIELNEELKNEEQSEKRKEIISEIKQITQKLKYFQQKSDQEIQKLFTISFDIMTVQEETILINSEEPCHSIYILLNGSALIEATALPSVENNDSLTKNKRVPAEFTLFDGDIFGESVSNVSKKYKIKIKTLEQSLLFKINEDEYNQVFFEGLEAQEKIEVLKNSFKLELMSGAIKEEDIELISRTLEKHTYAAKSLLFRQGDIFDHLIFIGKGKLSAINEFILEKEKEKLADMKEVDKNIRQERPHSAKPKSNHQKEASFHNFEEISSLSEMRRQNLINHEIVKQDQNKIYYYFMKDQEEFVKGDSLNWEPICLYFANSLPENYLEERFNHILESDVKQSAKERKYSLMSKLDDTQVYILSADSFKFLPNNLKTVLLQKGAQKCQKEVKVESEKEIRTWNNYKNELCKTIMQQKKNSKSRGWL